MSTQQIKGGKRPLDSKAPMSSFISHDDVYSNLLSVSDDLKKEIADKGLEYRWVDAKKMINEGNFHRAHWTVYKRDKVNNDILSWKLGNDPEGIIRRGSVVLAVRPKTQGDRHRTLLAQKAARQSGDLSKVQAETLREMAKASNTKTIVDDSFDGDK